MPRSGLAGLTPSGRAVVPVSWALYDFANTIFSFAVVSGAIGLYMIDRFGAQGVIRTGVVVFGVGFMLLSQIESLLGFYGALLQTAPVESSPTFALFLLDSGLKLGLWARDTVAPAPVAVRGSSARRAPSNRRTSHPPRCRLRG